MDAFADLVLLGKGTYGRVYKAVRVADGMTCVVKVVRIDAMTAEERAETFNESRVLEALTHRHVVACLDAFIDEARQEFCIVMEYAAGGDLGARITAQHGVYFAEETLWAWLMQLLDGLGYLHGQRVLHRDLKPQNIFLDDADDILIGDLGLGRILGSQSAMAYTSVGTPLYFSPEICEGRPYDDKSDVWGLGCLMYELAALVPPFTATNQVALAQRIVGEAPAALPQHYSMEFQFVVFKMLEKDVGRRPDVAQLSEFSCIVLRRERERLYAQSLAMQTAEEELRAQVRQRDLALDTLRRRASEESRELTERLGRAEQTLEAAEVRAASDGAAWRARLVMLEEENALLHAELESARAELAGVVRARSDAALAEEGVAAPGLLMARASSAEAEADQIPTRDVASTRSEDADFVPTERDHRQRRRRRSSNPGPPAVGSSGLTGSDSEDGTDRQPPALAPSLAEPVLREVLAQDEANPWGSAPPTPEKRAQHARNTEAVRRSVLMLGGGAQRTPVRRGGDGNGGHDSGASPERGRRGQTRARPISGADDAREPATPATHHAPPGPSKIHRSGTPMFSLATLGLPDVIAEVGGDQEAMAEVGALVPAVFTWYRHNRRAAPLPHASSPGVATSSVWVSKDRHLLSSATANPTFVIAPHAQYRGRDAAAVGASSPGGSWAVPPIRHLRVRYEFESAFERVADFTVTSTASARGGPLFVLTLPCEARPVLEFILEFVRPNAVDFVTVVRSVGLVRPSHATESSAEEPGTVSPPRRGSRLPRTPASRGEAPAAASREGRTGRRLAFDMPSLGAAGAAGSQALPVGAAGGGRGPGSSPVRTPPRRGRKRTGQSSEAEAEEVVLRYRPLTPEAAVTPQRRRYGDHTPMRGGVARGGVARGGAAPGREVRLLTDSGVASPIVLERKMTDLIDRVRQYNQAHKARAGDPGSPEKAETAGGGRW